jgi:hypothetical protein
MAQTRADLRLLIKGRLAFRQPHSIPGGFTDFDTWINLELVNAQEELEREFLGSPPWFLLSELAEAETTALEERLPVPLNFLLEYDEGTLYRFDDTINPASGDPWIELPKGFHEGLKERYQSTGAPVAYALVGKYFTLHPTPDAVYKMRMRYYKTDVPLGEAVANEWSTYAPNVLMNLAGSHVAEALRDQAALQIFGTSYAAAYTSLKRQVIAREQANRDAVRED